VTGAGAALTGPVGVIGARGGRDRTRQVNVRRPAGDARRRGTYRRGRCPQRKLLPALHRRPRHTKPARKDRHSVHVLCIVCIYVNQGVSRVMVGASAEGVGERLRGVGASTSPGVGLNAAGAQHGRPEGDAHLNAAIKSAKPRQATEPGPQTGECPARLRSRLVTQALRRWSPACTWLHPDSGRPARPLRPPPRRFGRRQLR
jgi:hypothetical protein